MILSFADKRTELFFRGERVKAFESIRIAARVKLDRLNLAKAASELALLPGNRFEALRGDREGQFSIRINDQWRICFRWDDEENGAAEVEVVDYH